MSNLFRNPPLEKKKNQLLGEVVLLQPISYSIIGTVIFIFVMLSIFYLYFGNLARQETVNGYIAPDAGILKIYPLPLGRVEKLFVQEGDLVKKGQLILSLRSSKTMAGGKEEKELLEVQIKNQITAVKNQIERVPKLSESIKRDLNSKIIAYNADITHLRALINTSSLNLDLQLTVLNKIKGLTQKKHLSRLKLIEAESSNLNYLADKQTLERALTQRIHEVEALNQSIDNLHFELEEKIDILKTEHSKLLQQLTSLRANHEYIIKAEIDGVVSGLQIKMGQQVNNNTPMLSLIPEDSQLQVELLVPTQAIGFIKNGQSVLLRYSAFPYQKFGLHKGNILRVSNNVLMPNELTGVPIKVTTPIYKVTVSLKSQFITAYGKHYKLRPGIKVSADIRLENRSLLEWFFEPIYSLKGRFI